MTQTDGGTEFEIPSVSGVRCEECGEHFDKVGAHWSHYPSHRPDLTDEQRRLVDAEVRNGEVQVESDRVNPYVEIYSTQESDLRDLDDALGILSMGIEESIPIVARRLGITVGEGESVYRLRTRSHPGFEQWADVGDDPVEQSHLGEWTEPRGGESEDVFSIPEPDGPIVTIRELLRDCATGVSVTISLEADEGEVMELFEPTPVDPVGIVEHGEGVDVALDGNEVAAWV